MVPPSLLQSSPVLNTQERRDKGLSSPKIRKYFYTNGKLGKPDYEKIVIPIYTREKIVIPVPTLARPMEP